MSASRRSVAWPEAAPPAICIAKSSRSSLPLSNRNAAAKPCAARPSVRSSVPTLSVMAEAGGRGGIGANLASDQRAPDFSGWGGPSASAKRPLSGMRSTVNSPSISAREGVCATAAAVPASSASSAREISALACATASIVGVGRKLRAPPSFTPAIVAARRENVHRSPRKVASKPISAATSAPPFAGARPSVAMSATMFGVLTVAAPNKRASPASAKGRNRPRRHVRSEPASDDVTSTS